MKPLTTSVYTFSDLIAGGYLYVDKTSLIHELIRGYKGQYFLVRPRHFGKSLLVSTLKVIFQGRRELFEGLAIAKTDYNWKPYPVIHLDMGDRQAGTAAMLETSLRDGVDEQAHVFKTDLVKKTAAARFRELVLKLAERDGKVVILVDEYDKPLLGQLGQPGVRELQSALKAFYGVIKATEAAQRFVLITGVSKFSKVSIFSDLNNLTDLTMNRSAATLLGYTQGELEANFPEHTAALAAARGKSREETLADLRAWYNGYRFHHEAETVYNPVSVMKCFYECEFKNYWFETGTPTFLVDLLRRAPVKLDDLTAAETDFSTYDPVDLAPLPLLVQTGYLTIKSAETTGRSRVFRLGYPNYEIEESFSRWLAQGFSRLPGEDLTGALQRMVAALNEGRVDEMLETLKVFFEKIPCDIAIANERYYQTIFFTVFTLIGARIEAEARTSIGRIDAVVKTKTDIFLFEFKLRGSAKQALRQIFEKRYFDPFLDDGRRVTVIGAAFSRKTRNLGRWVTETVVKARDHETPRVCEDGVTYGAEAGQPSDIGVRLPALARAVLRHVDAAGEIARAEENRRRAELELIAEWAPSLRDVWQSWKPRPGEVIAMLCLCEVPPHALRQIVKECKNGCLHSEDWVGSGTVYRTELTADPAKNEEAVFPVPLPVYRRLASAIELLWIDRDPRRKA